MSTEQTDKDVQQALIDIKQAITDAKAKQKAWEKEKKDFKNSVVKQVNGLQKRLKKLDIGIIPPANVTKVIEATFKLIISGHAIHVTEESSIEEKPHQLLAKAFIGIGPAYELLVYQGPTDKQVTAYIKTVKEKAQIKKPSTS